MKSALHGRKSKAMKAMKSSQHGMKSKAMKAMVARKDGNGMKSKAMKSHESDEVHESDDPFRAAQGDQGVLPCRAIDRVVSEVRALSPREARWRTLQSDGMRWCSHRLISPSCAVLWKEEQNNSTRRQYPLVKVLFFPDQPKDMF